MKQQQVIQKKQEIRQKIAQHTRRSQVPDQVQDHPYLQAQGIIGNHGMLRRHPGVIQAKLKVSPPGDKYEQEADWVTEKVMRTPERNVQRQSELKDEEELVQTKPIAGQITPLVQRLVDDEFDKEEEKEDKLIQTKGVSKQAPQVTPDVAAQINAMRGGGQPLPESTRAFFESRFGYDFSKVRVHTGRLAAESTSELKARAFTVGRDIAFGASQYAPETARGRQLLSHELTHVAQWMTHPSPRSGIAPSTHAAEVEANRAASGGMAQHVSPPGGAIQLNRSSIPTQPKDLKGLSYIKDAIKILIDEVAYYSRFPKVSLKYYFINRILSNWRRIHNSASNKFSKIWPRYRWDPESPTGRSRAPLDPLEKALRKQLNYAYRAAIDNIIKLTQDNGPSAIGFVGLRSIASKELDVLKRAVKSRKRGRTVKEKILGILPPKMERFKFRREWYGAVKTPKMETFVSQELGISPKDKAKFKAALKCLRRCEHSFQEQMGDMMRMFRDAELGKYRIGRLVFSGHAAGGGFRNPTGGISGRNLVLEENPSLKIDEDLGNIVAAFPLASAHIEHIMVSRCRSITLIKTLAKLFPRIKTIWVYKLQSPTVEQGSYIHIKHWETITKGQDLPARGIISIGKPLPKGATIFGSSVIWTREKGFFIPFVIKR